MESTTLDIRSSKKIRQIQDRLATSEPFIRLAAQIKEAPAKAVVSGLNGSSTAMMIAALHKQQQQPVYVITQNSEAARDLADDLSFLLGEKRVGHFPSRQILPYDFRAPVGEVMGQRISTLAALCQNRLAAVVCPLRALIEPTIVPEQLTASSLHLRQGEEYDLDNVVDKLVQLGFSRVPLVEEIGNFALRGGLIDLFSPGAEAPVRVEFFGDEIETIREFDVGSQRTLKKVEQVVLLPRREIPITQETLESYLERLPHDDAEYVRHRYLNDPELPGLEWLAIAFGLEKGCLLDYCNGDSLFVLEGEGSLKDESEAIFEEASNLRSRLTRNLKSLPQPEEYYFSFDALLSSISQKKKIDLVPFRGADKGVIDFSCKPHPSFGSRLDLVGQAVTEFRQNNIEFMIATDTPGQAERLGELIVEKSDLNVPPPIEIADLKGGFVCREHGYAVLTDHEIFSRYHRRVRKKRFKEGVAISDYSSLNRGDYVVHTDHGVARYLGLQTIVVDEKSRDCLLLEYAAKDKLYVPIEEFNRVSKFSGKDTAPVLTQLGGPGWDKLKTKTQKAVEDMAEDLIKLYAERKARPGTAFSPDTVWLKQLEASFPYEETRDQLRAINEVKRDLEEERPTDRLVCGDVGYGKTEVAVRAAFKVIENGKQVAVLVPTTILAQQHHQTFKERFADFPFTVEVLSRFRTRKEQLETIENLEKGKVDLVVGTHRLLSKDVVFRDLGLLVVDEEHRFGVRHKEKLRQIKATVDTISMTATPIPRTLQMSLVGVRDMSIISTSPKDRLPIITEISEFDPAVIATAILREIDRGGQVFFVHNRVQTIEAMYKYLKKILPQVEIAIAHGQMHEKSLEGIMLAFMQKRFDVLLCTSIIESGLDIPSANTIIVNRADRFGLAQLYQIRGRVGRSARRAYAYLLTPQMKLLKADAVKRLRALEAHSDLGSGFALAMRDLEIRGAGSMLGARQSGFIEEIGFDLYNKLLEEAIAKLKGQEVTRLPDTKLELDIETFISEEFISDRQHKVDVYRRIADCREVDEVEKIREEVIDRFGKLPLSTENLFEAALVKIMAAGLDMDKVKMKNGRCNLFYKENHTISRRDVEAFRQATDCPLEFSLTGRSQVILDLGNIKIDERIKYVRTLLSKI